MKNNYYINNIVNKAINELSGIQLNSQEGWKEKDRSSHKNYMRTEDRNKMVAIVDSFIELQHQRGYPIIPNALLQIIVKEQLKKHKVIAAPTFLQKRKGEDNHKLRNLDKFSKGFAEAYKHAQGLAESYDDITQLIEAWRFELIDANRQAFAKKIVEKVGKGEFPEAYKDIEKVIRANADGQGVSEYFRNNKKKVTIDTEEERKNAKEGAFNYTNAVQNGTKKTTDLRDLGNNILLTLHNKLNINYFGSGEDFGRELNATRDFLNEKGIQNTQATEEILKDKYPLVRALLSKTIVSSILKEDMASIQRYGSALAKRDENFFKTWQNGLTLVEEAQKDIVDLLRKNNGVITKDVEKKLAEYNIKALEYLKYQIEKTPEVTQIADSKMVKEKGKKISKPYVRSETIQFGKVNNKLSKEQALTQLDKEISVKKIMRNLINLEKPPEQKQEEQKQVKKPEKQHHKTLPNGKHSWNKEARRLGIPEVTREVFNEFIGWQKEQSKQGRNSSLKLFAEFKQWEKAVEILGSELNFTEQYKNWESFQEEFDRSPSLREFASGVIREFKNWQEEAKKAGIPNTPEVYRGFKNWQEHAGRTGKEPTLGNFKKAKVSQLLSKDRKQPLTEDEKQDDNRNRSTANRRKALLQRLNESSKQTHVDKKLNEKRHNTKPNYEK